jgi:hypothetical protein
MVLKKSFPFFQVFHRQDEVVAFDPAFDHDGTAAMRRVPVLLGESELQVAFVANEVGALLAVALFVFIASVACVEIGRKVILPSVLIKKFIRFPSFL